MSGVLNLPTEGKRRRVQAPDEGGGEGPTSLVSTRRPGVGQSGAEGAPFVGVTTAAGNRSAVSPELPEFKKYPKAL